MRLITTPYGPPATAHLAEVVAEAKGDDPLASVTVVVPHNYAGVSARRSLGRSVVTGQRAGVAAVQFLTAYRLAELLGGPRLAAAGRRPVSTAVLAATVRGVLASNPGIFARVREHPATERALVAAHRELSELGPGELERLAAQGSRAADVVRIHRAVWARLHTEWYVETDLAAAASDSVAADPSLAVRLGAVVWYLPQSVPPSMAGLAVAIDARVPGTTIVGVTGVEAADAPVAATVARLGIAVTAADLVAATPLVGDRSTPMRVVSGSDADEEVRVVVRAIVDAARRGMALDTMAVLHPGRDPYARLLHEHLAAAGIDVNGTTPRTLAESVYGRTLVALLDLPDHRFRRTEVMAMLASAPIRWRGRLAPSSAWERLSRAAGVVDGPRQWAQRLGRHAAELRERAESEAAGDHRKWLIERVHRDAARCDSLAAFVEQLVADTTASTGSSWRERSRWATRLLRTHLGSPGNHWPAIEVAAAEKVEAALNRLAGLDIVEPSPSPSVFRRTLLHELEASLGRVGRLGSGVLVASPHDAVGVDLGQMFVVGLAEGSFPGRVHDDSLLPDRERSVVRERLPLRADRPLDDQRHLLAVLAAADEATITWPRGDLRRNAERLPSRWLVELVEQAVGPFSGPGLIGADAPWLTDIPSHVGGLLRSSFPPSAHEYDLRSLLDNDRAGTPVDEYVAVRANRSLARGLELVRSRGSSTPGRFDGMIGARPELDPTGEGQVVSATRLETWVQCPFKYFMQYVLSVSPVDEVDELVEISALDRGSVVHAVLDQFVSEVLARPAAMQPAPGDAWTPADRQRIGEIAEHHLTSLEARGLTGWGVFWRPNRREILRDLQRFLVADDHHRRDMRACPHAAELGFGMIGGEAGPLAWRLPDGRDLLLRGAADRVDLLEGDAMAVLDYKTGSARKFGVSADNPDAAGSVLQLPVYAQAARRALGRPHAPVWAAYWFVSSRGGFGQIGYPVTDEILERFDHVFSVIADGIASGTFVPRPDEPASFVPYVTCPFCDPDGLGTRHRWAEWENHRHHRSLAPYLALVEPDLVATSMNPS